MSGRDAPEASTVFEAAGVRLYLGDASSIVPTLEGLFDPFMGSGSTIVAALMSGRKAVGIEKDPTHFATAVRRVERLLPTLLLLESA